MTWNPTASAATVEAMKRHPADDQLFADTIIHLNAGVSHAIHFYPVKGGAEAFGWDLYNPIWPIAAHDMFYPAPICTQAPG